MHYVSACHIIWSDAGIESESIMIFPLGGISIMAISAISIQPHGLERTMGVSADVSQILFLCWLSAAEIPMVFGTYNLSTISSPSAREVAASRYIQGSTFSQRAVSSPQSTNWICIGAWVAFAKDPWSGLTRYGWPQFRFHSRLPGVFCIVDDHAYLYGPRANFD